MQNSENVPFGCHQRSSAARALLKESAKPQDWTMPSWQATQDTIALPPKALRRIWQKLYELRYNKSFYVRFFKGQP